MTAFPSGCFNVLNLIAKHRIDIHSCRFVLKEGCRRPSSFQDNAAQCTCFIKKPMSPQSIPGSRRLARLCNLDLS
jgi:hypothetical protein